MGFAGGDVDIYGYCWNDPNNFVDRDGLKGESEDSDEKSSKKDRNVSKDQKETNDKELIEGLEREYDDPKPSAIIWGGDKRSIFNGPKYGKWGGELHSGGVDGGKIGTAPPVDSSDEVYKEHDLAYDDIQHEDILSDVNKEQKRLIKKADKALVEGLERLGGNSTRWAKPPKNEDKEDAEWYRRAAIKWFDE